MRDMMKGHGIEPLYGIVDELSRNGSLERIGSDVTRLTSVGHSSGWDMLAGVLAALLYVYRILKGHS